LEIKLKNQNYIENKNSKNLINKLDYFNQLFFDIISLIEKNFSFPQLDNNITNNPYILSLIGPNNLGITYILKNICDFKGFYFIKKDFGKYNSISQILNYFKKIEFLKIYCHKIFLIKNASNIFSLIEKEYNKKFKSEIYNIFSYKRINSFDRNCFIFHFEKNSDINPEWKDLFTNFLSYNLTDFDSREILLNKITNNFIFNDYILRNLKFKMRIKEKFNNNLLFELYKLFEDKKNVFPVNLTNKELIISNNDEFYNITKIVRVDKLNVEEDYIKKEYLEFFNLNSNMKNFIEKEFDFLINLYYVIFTKTDFKELSRLTIGFNLKDLKNLINYFFSNTNKILSSIKEKLIFSIHENSEKSLYFEFEINQYFKEQTVQFKKCIKFFFSVFHYKLLILSFIKSNLIF